MCRVNISALNGLSNFQSAQHTDDFECLRTDFRGFRSQRSHGDRLSLYCVVWRNEMPSRYNARRLGGDFSHFHYCNKMP